jgi:hypothetical protein
VENWFPAVYKENELYLRIRSNFAGVLLAAKRLVRFTAFC